MVSEILGLTNSAQGARARRIQRVLFSILGHSKQGLAGKVGRAKAAFHSAVFFLRDVRPAMKARRSSPKNDAISFFIEENYSGRAIMVESSQLPRLAGGLHETRLFLDRLDRLPGLTLEQDPELGWNHALPRYELRNAWITCHTAEQ